MKALDFLLQSTLRISAPSVTCARPVLGQEREAAEHGNKKRIDEFVSSFNAAGDEFLTKPEFDALLRALHGEPPPTPTRSTRRGRAVLSARARAHRVTTRSARRRQSGC